MKQESQLEDIMKLYLSAKENPDNPQHLTSYSIDYIMLRDSGMQHHVAMQKLNHDYLNIQYGVKQ